MDDIGVTDKPTKIVVVRNVERHLNIFRHVSTSPINGDNIYWAKCEDFLNLMRSIELSDKLTMKLIFGPRFKFMGDTIISPERFGSNIIYCLENKTYNYLYY